MDYTQNIPQNGYYAVYLGGCEPSILLTKKGDSYSCVGLQSDKFYKTDSNAQIGIGRAISKDQASTLLSITQSVERLEDGVYDFSVNRYYFRRPRQHFWDEEFSQFKKSVIEKTRKAGLDPRVATL